MKNFKKNDLNTLNKISEYPATLYIMIKHIRQDRLAILQTRKKASQVCH